MTLDRRNLIPIKGIGALPVLVLIASVVLLSFLGSYFPQMTEPVYEPWFGKFFVWVHFFVGLFILLFILSSPLWPNRIKRMMKLEAILFKSRYSIDTGGQNQNSGAGFLVFLMALSTAIIGIFPIGGGYLLGTYEYSKFLLVPGFILFSIVFFWLASILTGRLKKKGQDLFEQVSRQLKETHLSFDELSSKPSYIGRYVQSMQSDTVLSGMFKGKKFEFENRITGRTTNITASRTRVNFSLNVTFHIKSSVQFTLEEKNPKWRTKKANHLDSYFEERYSLNGCSISQLPHAFKKLAADYPRNLYLKVEKDKMIYRFEGRANEPLLTYYSLPGLVLFLDDLSEMATDLEK